MLEIAQITDSVRRSAKPGAKLLLQVPEGLKTRAVEIIDALGKHGFSTALSNDPCYGACDIRDGEARMLGCDMIVHVGHKRFYKPFRSGIPVLYIPFEIEAEYDRKELEKIREMRIGILSTVNYAGMMESVARDLKSMDKTAVIGGTVLGCNFQAMKDIDNRVDCFLFIGSGRFHATGIRTLFPVYVLDLEKNKVELMDKKEFDRIKRIVYAKMEKFREARTVGILLSSKQGQFFQDSQALKKRVESTGKKCYLIVMDCITRQGLMGLKIDFFLNTACPRIAEDDLGKTVINASDFLEFYG